RAEGGTSQPDARRGRDQGRTRALEEAGEDACGGRRGRRGQRCRRREGGGREPELGRCEKKGSEEVRVKVHGVLIWYDERPSWLAGCVASLARACDTLTAIDGAYFLYPGSLERPRSAVDQATAILEAAYGAGLAVTLHVPSEPWFGNEVEKRSYSFQVACARSELGVDWIIVFDADMLVDFVAADLREQLARTSEDTGTYELFWRGEDQQTRGRNDSRSLYRALPN